MSETLTVSGEYNFDWMLCLVKDNTLYFSKNDPKEVCGDDWNDAPASCNAGAPSPEFPYFTVDCVSVFTHNDVPFQSAQDYNDLRKQLPWLTTRSYDVWWSHLSISVYSGITFRNFLKLCNAIGAIVLSQIKYEETINEPTK
jgi:hypothetical protein